MVVKRLGLFLVLVGSLWFNCLWITGCATLPRWPFGKKTLEADGLAGKTEKGDVPNGLPPEASAIKDSKVSKPLLLLISDGDDTIAVSHVLTRNHFQNLTKAAHAMTTSDAFIGAPELFQDLEGVVDEFHFVSGMPGWLNDSLPGGLTRFLRDNRFPFAESHVHLRQTLKEGTYEFKVRALREIFQKHLKESPTQPLRVLFVGDNGERDVDVYQDIETEFKAYTKNNQIKFIGTYIHRLYDGSPALPVKGQQRAFYTYADLALSLYGNGDQFLSVEQAALIIDLTIKALESKAIALNSPRHRVVPHWVEWIAEDLRRLREQISGPCREIRLAKKCEHLISAIEKRLKNLKRI